MGLLALAGCKESDDTLSVPKVQALSFDYKIRDIIATHSFKPVVTVTSEGEKVSASERNFGLTYLSSNGEIATASPDGLIKTLKTGTCTITVRSKDGNSASMRLNVINPSVFTKALTSSMIYTSGKQLVDNSVMQSFAFGSDEYLYFTQVGTGTNANGICLSRRQKDGDTYEYMRLKYFGHGQNLSVDSNDGAVSCWVTNYGTKNSSGTYVDAQTIARIPFNAGQTMTSIQTTENYWIPDCKNLQVSLDETNDMMLLYTVYGSSASPRYFVYRLSEARAIVPESRTLSFKCAYGGEVGSDYVNDYQTVMVKDLSTIKPISVFDSKLGGKQGYEIHNGYIYIMEGAGNNNDGKSASTGKVYICDLNGNQKDVFTITASTRMEPLLQFGLTMTGYMEPEGLKITNGKAYLGFASKSTDDIRRVVIFEYYLLS